MTVFANMMEISSKAQGCKVIAAFPDTCFTPPQTPATPPGVPIPYPDFGFDSDLTKGTGTVKIKNKEVSQENASQYSKCSGDEAGAAPKKGIVTSNNRGKVYAQKWSMDVKFEGKGVVRFADIATSNHRSNPGDTPPMVLVGKPTTPPYFENPKCLVGSYEATKDKCSERGGQAHHIIPDEYSRKTGKPRAEWERLAAKAKGAGQPDPSRISPDLPGTAEGCCVCVGGNAYGSTARQSKPRSQKGKDAQAAIIRKGEAHAKKSGKDLTMMKGHGFLHQFDERFREMNPHSVDNALKCADELLDECAKYDQSALDSKCAKMAKECIKKQFAQAKANGTNLRSITPRSAESKAKRVKKLTSVP